MTRLGVLVSGRGSNLEAIITACRDGRIAGEVVVVASNRATCRAMQVARERGVPTVVAFPVSEFGGNLTDRDAAMAAALRDAEVDLVVTAGYDRINSEDFVAAFPGRILNVHPSLLPAFGGSMRAIAEALEAGVKVTGVTVHFIEPKTLDSGAIVAQECVRIEPDDTLETLSERVHAVEHRVLPEAIQWWIDRR